MLGSILVATSSMGPLHANGVRLKKLITRYERVCPMDGDEAIRPVNRECFTVVGGWTDDDHPKDHVDQSWNEPRDKLQKRAVLSFIKAGIKVNKTKGWANCRICGEPLGCCDLLLPGGRFLCPDQYDHYIKRHNVKPPSLLIEDAVAWYTKHNPMAEKPFLKLVIDLRTGEVVYRRLIKEGKYGKK